VIENNESIEAAGTNNAMPSMNKPDFHALETLYKLSIETRNFEITQLVQRNNFFMIFQGVLLAGLMQASGSNPTPVIAFLVCATGFIISMQQTGMAAGAKFWQERWEHDVEFFEKCLLEMLPKFDDRKNTYMLFSKSTKDSKKIVKARLTTIKDSVEITNDFLKSKNNSKEIVQSSSPSKETLKARSFLTTFSDALTNYRFSVSRIPIYSGLAFSIVWLLLLLCTIKGPFGSLIPPFLVGFPKA